MSMEVLELRKRFLNEFVTCRFNYHEEDARRVRENDFHVQRFILHNDQGPNHAFYQMKDTFKWKKKFGVHDFNVIENIPREILQLGPMFTYGKDIDGVVPIFIRMKMILKIHDKIELKMKQYFIHMIDQVDHNLKKANSWSLVFDADGASIENANFDLLFFAMEMIGQHFPLEPKYVLVVNIPWIFKPFVNMGLAMIPEQAKNLLKFVDTKELLEMFKIEDVPDFMGGKLQPEQYLNIPTNSKSYLQIGKKILKMDEEQLKRTFEPILEKLKEPSPGSSSESNNNDVQNSKLASDFLQEFD